MADEKSASTAAKSARASSAKSTTKSTAPGDPSSTSSDTGKGSGSTSTRTDTTRLAQSDSSQSTPAGDNANPGAAGTDSGATHGTSASNAQDTARPSSAQQGNNSSTGEAVKEAVTGRPELGSGQRLAGQSEHDYPAVNSPRLSDPDGGTGDEAVEQFSAVGTLSPTRLDERNRVGQVDDDVKAAQFPTPRFNQGPPNVVVQSQVPPPFAEQYTQIDDDLFEIVYPPGTTTPSSRLVAPAGSFVRSDFLTETMAHAAKDIASAGAAKGTAPGDTEKDEHRREVAQQ